LFKCLEAISNQTFSLDRIEVFVCDDGSGDDTATIVQGFEAPFRLIYLRQRNRGPAAARNMGIRQATGEYLLILNDDAILEPNALELHYRSQQENKNRKVAVLGRFSFPATLTERSVFGYILEHTDALFYYNRMKDGEIYNFDHFYTCNISIRRDAVLEVGLFDEDFTGPAAEDIELGYRLEQKGYGVLFVAQIVAWHDHCITPESFLKTHIIRTKGTLTLIVKQPGVPFYKGYNFNKTAEMQLECEKQQIMVNQIIEYLTKCDAAISNCPREQIEKAANELMPAIQFLIAHAGLVGILSSPLLPELIRLRSGGDSSETTQ
jgi:GT2 family glycosyltransferase